jgi:hypothetical protein
MSAAAVMAIVLFLFFLVGVAVGVLVVVAVSARRAHKAQVRPVAPAPGNLAVSVRTGSRQGRPGRISVVACTRRRLSGRDSSWLREPQSGNRYW